MMGPTGAGRGLAEARGGGAETGEAWRRRGGEEKQCQERVERAERRRNAAPESATCQRGSLRRRGRKLATRRKCSVERERKTPRKTAR
eukprot:1108879-Rhodomonas_salina.1